MRKVVAFLVLGVAFAILPINITHAIADSTPELVINNSIPSVIVAGNISINVSLPTSVVLAAQDTIKWSGGDWINATPITDPIEFDRSTTYANDVQHQDLGRSATFSIQSHLAGSFNMTLQATDANDPAKIFAKKTLRLNFAPSDPNSKTDYIVAPIPDDSTLPDVKVNVPDPMQDQVATAIVTVTPKSGRINGYSVSLSTDPLTNTSPGMISGLGRQNIFTVSELDYLRTKYYVFVEYGELVPQLYGHFMFGDVVRAHVIPLTIPFSTSNYSPKPFRWQFADGTTGANGSYRTGSTDPRTINFSFDTDVRAMLPGPGCQTTIVLLQKMRNGTWVTNMDYSGGAQTFSDCLGRVEQTYDDASKVAYSHSSANGIEVPYAAGTQNYRIVEGTTMGDFNWIDPKVSYNKVLDSFSLTSPPTFLAKSDLKLSISYPKQVLFGQRYTTTVSTKPIMSGVCEYFGFNHGSFLLGKSALQKGKSTLTYSANWFVDSISGSKDGTRALTVKCRGGNRLGENFVLYNGLGHP
jgi:hypothetical protein